MVSPEPGLGERKAKKSIMTPRETCPQCGSTWFKRNGHIHSGKQNHRCRRCGRAFVLNPENHIISEEQRTLIARLLLERISLRGICRAMGVGLRWLLQFMDKQFRRAPAHLHVQSPGRAPAVILQRLEAELDELWSFVGKKANRQWVWIAMDATTRQVIAFHVGDRSQASAAQLWANLPAIYRDRAIFHTDQYAPYKGVIPPARHCAISKLARKTNHVERFNCTLRQRVSRLVRGTLSFSKNFATHIGALKYFICHDNLTK